MTIRNDRHFQDDSAKENPFEMPNTGKRDTVTGEMYEAVCDSVVFRNDDNGYTVAQFAIDMHSEGNSSQLTEGELNTAKKKEGDSSKILITAVGFFPYVEEGDRVSLSGTWTTHGTFGRQLSASSVLPLIPHTTKEILAYLSSGVITGIGPKTAERILAMFGENSLKILRDAPEQLARVRGISQQKAKEISLQFKEKEAFRELSLLLIPLHVSQKRIQDIYRKFGSGALDRIRRNPYLLAEEVSGIGFRTADRIAVGFGIEPESAFRYASAILHCVHQTENEGHTYVRLDELLVYVRKLLQTGTESFSEAEESADRDIYADSRSDDMNSRVTEPFFQGLDQLTEKKRIVLFQIDKDGTFRFAEAKEKLWDLCAALPMILASEISAAKKIAVLANKGKSIAGDQQKLDLLERVSVQSGIALSDEQRQAVLTSAGSCVSVITGGPGTGKTTIIRVLIDYFHASGHKAVLCAPTGRAAKRMSEASGQAAGTIHRLLEIDAGERSEGYVTFRRNEDNPLDADTVIVDETSMLDIYLFDSLLQALKPDAQIIFVGDVNQLPSVGCGNVLSDIIMSGIVPVSSLTHIYRQASRSGIVKNAYRILNGESILFDQSLESDCMIVNREGMEEIAQAAVKLYAKVLPEVYHIDVLRDAMVLCPSRKGPAGVTDLNVSLQKAVNEARGYTVLSRGFSYRLRDKVMQTRNNYEIAYTGIDGTSGKGVFNGEQGTVVELDAEEESLTVMMDDNRIIRYDRESLEDLDPAYAVTVHKSQGSEYPVVILVVPPGFSMLNNRNLLYTAVTRAKKRLFIVSSKGILDRAIRNRYTSKRKTSLTYFLKAYALREVDRDDV